MANLDSYEGPVWLVTVTAPGKEGLAHDDDGNVKWGSAFMWNKQCPHHWRKLYDAAQRNVLRNIGRRANVLAWVWQYQARGVLHKHLVVGVGTALERAAADALVSELGRLSSLHRFGFVDRGKWDHQRGRRCLREMTGKHAGRYVAKYLVQRLEDGRYAVSETVTHDDVPPLVVYVARSLTDGTGITMRHLRQWRYDVATGAVVEISPAFLRAVLAQQSPEWRMENAHLVAAANAPPQEAQPVSHAV